MYDLYQPLDDDEIAWLGEFLLDRIDDDADTEGRDEGILDISELDGFFTAIVSGPVTVLPSQWIPQVWGDFEPVWEREQDVQNKTTMAVERWPSCHCGPTKPEELAKPISTGKALNK